ncbi:MAG: carboxymuconolactone decarboxylase family protein [Rhizobiales bacterium]|nr:carboxymuconolactone decarboxylase family protein [Hyphomicrobiales bacterium]
MTTTFRLALSVLVVAAGLTAAVPSRADGVISPDAVYADVQKTFGGVPGFVKMLPKSTLAGLWQQEKDLELSDKTALPPKTKALISLAVAAQIPCEYCIWADTQTARQLGASDEEIGEAVAMAGLTRNWSTLFNGLQVDFAQFKKDLGGQ